MEKHRSCLGIFTSMNLRHAIALGSFALGACGSTSAPAREELLARTWSPSSAACGQEYLKFSETAFEAHHTGRPSSALEVLDIVPVPENPTNVMVVIGPNPPGSGNAVSEQDRVAFLLEVSGRRLKLLAQGSPQQMLPIAPGDPNAGRFDRVACA